MVSIVFNLKYLSQNQIKHVGGVLESSWRADSKTVIGSPIWPRIHGENMENVLLQTEPCRLYDTKLGSYTYET